VAFIGINWDDYTNASLTAPTGTTPTFTERLDSSTTIIYVATGELAAAGATGNKTHTNSNTSGSSPWLTFMVAVESPGGGVTLAGRVSLLGVGR
jgi:hypothetical protein